MSCHKDCPPSLKKYELKEGKKFICDCQMSLYHKAKASVIKTNSDKNEIEKTFGLKTGFFKKLSDASNSFEIPDNMTEEKLKKFTGLINYQDFVYSGFYHCYKTEMVFSNRCYFCQRCEISFILIY